MLYYLSNRADNDGVSFIKHDEWGKENGQTSWFDVGWYNDDYGACSLQWE
jgi:hypothetical protein